MPIYAYKCESCGHGRDVLQKISDPLLTTCPACGAESFKKQLTAAGFQLKGSGWYVTDFRGGNSSNAASSSAAAPTTSSSSGESSSSGSASGGSSAGASETSSASTASAGGCGSSCACH